MLTKNSTRVKLLYLCLKQIAGINATIMHSYESALRLYLLAAKTRVREKVDGTLWLRASDCAMKQGTTLLLGVAWRAQSRVARGS